MGRAPRTSWLSYPVAVLATAVVVLARFAFNRYLGDRALFLPFVGAVAVTASLGGLGPGLVATGLSAAAAIFLFIEPAYSWHIAATADRAHLVLFLLVGALVSGLCESLRRHRSRAEGNAREAAQKYWQLEQVVTQRAQAEEALREGDRRKDEFLAVLGHELRNPLAPLRNALHVVRLSGADEPLREQACGMMERQLLLMVRLIDDLLDVSRIGRNQLHLRKERVELAQVLHDAVETSRPVIEAAGHELKVTLPAGPVWLDADPTRLTQVFTNLLNNAAKFTEQGGRIALTAAVVGGGSQTPEAVVTVRDSGIGIPADRLAHIFEMFMQVDTSPKRKHAGLGIGLTLVKRLIDLHGGKVEAHSGGPDQGSAFTVRLPVAAEGTPADSLAHRK